MIDAPVVEDVGPLAEKLAVLPLLVRYRRSASAIADDLAAAQARGDGMVVWRDRAGAEPSGLAWFQAEGTLAMGGYLRLLAVVSGAERRGVGAALLAAFERVTATRCRRAFLLVSDFNGPAQRFYRRHGYEQVGRLPGLILPDVDELLFWKRLGRNGGDSA